MSDYIFLFDLDSTITKKEILPTISEEIGKLSEMRELTEATMRGEIPFKTSFLNRVKILSDINVSKVSDMVAEIPLNNEISKFIKNNHERCYIVTGNLDVWISKLMEKLNIKNNVYCSKALVKNDIIDDVINVADKELIAKQFVKPIVVIGDGSNDVGMARIADISIGFGGVRDIAPELKKIIDYEFYDDKLCAEFLKTLL